MNQPRAKIALVPCVSNRAAYGYKPERAYDDAMAMDFKTPYKFAINPGETVAVDLGLKIETPTGYGLLLAPRSGLGSRGLQIANTVGLIDPDYRGNLIAVLYLRKEAEPMYFDAGDRIVQGTIVAASSHFDLVLESDLSSTARDDKGFNSTGVK